MFSIISIRYNPSTPISRVTGRCLSMH